MADFLITSGVTHHLEQLLSTTREKLILISPYLKINERIKQQLQDLDRSKTDIRLVFRENKLSPAEQMWLEGLPSIRTSIYEHLHAKCYLNENEAIVTSMNLYESSQVNNYEMGIHVVKDEEPGLYGDIYEAALTVIRYANEIRITVAEVPKTVESGKASATPKSGFCIRCGAELKLNPMVPYCKDCYSKWKKTKDDTHVERYCHICGQPTHSTILKPTCYNCYRSNKNKLEFPMASSK